MCIISRLVRHCHRRRRVIIVSPVAIVITIVIVSCRAAAYQAVAVAIVACSTLKLRYRRLSTRYCLSRVAWIAALINWYRKLRTVVVNA